MGSGDNRTAVWKEVWPAVVRFPLIGTGGGTLPRAEQAFRQQAVGSDSVRLVVNSAHNEYLEAAVEGGVGRLLITIALAVAAIGTCGNAGARKLHARSVGPLLLGTVYGLTRSGRSQYWGFRFAHARRRTLRNGSRCSDVVFHQRKPPPGPAASGVGYGPNEGEVDHDADPPAISAAAAPDHRKLAECC